MLRFLKDKCFWWSLPVIFIITVMAVLFALEALESNCPIVW